MLDRQFCNHTFGPKGSLIVARDGCSLECEVCHEIVCGTELVAIPLKVVGQISEHEWILRDASEA